MNTHNETAKIIYNVTTQINAESSAEWLHWMLHTHIPGIMQTGCFEKYQLVKLLIEADDVESYAIQYYATSLAEYNRFEKIYIVNFEQQVFEKWGAESINFATVMEII